MKRILAAVLAIILCLSLCACSDVKQEVYDTLKAGYDEVTAKYDELKSKVDKYSTVIEALEKEDYDGAVDAVNAMRPAPKVTEIEITMDNLWDYFEIKEKRFEQKDAQGKLYGLSIYNNLSLKEEYELANTEEYPTDVSVGVEYDEHYSEYNKSSQIDFDTLTCNGTAYFKDNNHKSIMAHYPETTELSYMFANNDPNYATSLTTISDFEVLNASGTLYLVNK